jgi:hypothetical protein
MTERVRGMVPLLLKELLALVSCGGGVAAAPVRYFGVQAEGWC